MLTIEYIANITPAVKIIIDSINNVLSIYSYILYLNIRILPDGNINAINAHGIPPANDITVSTFL